MTVWESVSQKEHFALILGMFLILCVQLFYLLRAFEHRRTKLYMVSAVWFVLLFSLLILLHGTDLLREVPLWAPLVVTTLSAAFAGGAVLYQAKLNKNSITRASIKEAMDNLPVAGCYFTDRGRVKLCNRQMYRLYHTMTGQDLQSLDELHDALTGCIGNGIYTSGDGGYVFPDGRVWYYSENRITAGGRQYTEALFTDATEFSIENEELLRDSEELKRINAKLQKMYVRAEDRIREREYLAFKMKIHDDIGRSLAVIRRALQNGLTGEDEDIERQIKKLSLAAGTLVYSPRADSPDPYDQLLAEAAELGVEVRLDGMLPLEPTIYDLVVKAVRECVTNCIRHAHGTAVFVRVAGMTGGYSVTITNDGETPDSRIIEGGGLSNLRQSVESAGGEMSVSHYPGFVLNLTMMREEMEL